MCDNMQIPILHDSPITNTKLKLQVHYIDSDDTSSVSTSTKRSNPHHGYPEQHEQSHQASPYISKHSCKQ